MPPTDWPSLHGNAFAHTRVLVTGGAGFIGSHLCEALTTLNAEVVALDDLSGTSGQWQNLDDFAGKPFGGKKINASVLDADALADAADGCAFVFHLAALGSVPGSIREPGRYQKVNVEGTLNVLEAARAAHARRVVFAASSAAYGDTPVQPKTESAPPAPLSPYAATKVAGEALLHAYAHSYGPNPTPAAAPPPAGLDTISLRYFNVFGPRQNANSAYAAVIAAFAQALLAGQHPVVFGDGQQSRDFTHVDNVVHANLLAARAPRPSRGAICNVAAGQRITVNQLAAAMADALKQPQLTPDHRPARVGDVLHSSADLTAARQTLGYEPVVEFAAGLAQTLDWYAKENP